MPYDTRRKSLSLPSLGIQLPNASRAHRPSTSKASPTHAHASPPQPPPSKKVKRSHTSDSASPPHSSPSRTSTSSVTKNVTFADRPKSSRRGAYHDTPPASPEPTAYKKYDTHGINDDIVVGVIEQLEKTGNRPHLIRELATVLSESSDAVASSANPGALLSSRLAAYIKRPGWTALAPCPLEKELTSVHPRKVYYYLTTIPRQGLPSDSSDLFTAPNAAGKGGKRIISPSVSSASVDEDTDAAEERKREAMSPSPELDLSSHEIAGDANEQSMDFEHTFPSRSSLSRSGSKHSSFDHVLPHSQRTASPLPPLEGAEKEFTQTASSARMRGMSLDGPDALPIVEVAMASPIEETEEEKAKLNREAAEALFGTHHPQLLHSIPGSSPRSSPVVRPMQLPGQTQVKQNPVSRDVEMQPTLSILGGPDVDLTWGARESEDIQLEDLDDLFGSC